VERTQSYKDASTIFVSQLPIYATAKEVMNHFSKVGRVLDVRLIPSEKGSRKSRGFGYIEFDTPDQAIKAVAEMSSEKFQGRTLFIQSQVKTFIFSF
jgi:RNA recognition motif-containing protein